jgi:CHAT domain-containing protein/tetratricopeptide (TPR) repeat protein
MATRFLISLLVIILIAGTLVRSSPARGTNLRAIPHEQTARKQVFTAKIKAFAKVFRAGDFNTAASLALRGYQDALAAREPHIAGLFLVNLGGCRFAQHQYQEALRAYTEARTLVEASGDNIVAGKLDLNISSICDQLRQMDAAVESAKSALRRLSIAGTPPAALWIHLAHLYIDQNHLPEAVGAYRRGISAADRAGDPEMAATGWNDLGFDYLERNLPEAEPTLLEAYRIRKLNHLRTIESSYRNLGMLRLEQGDIFQASLLLDKAVEFSARPGGMRPEWEVYHARGRVRMAEHRVQDALDDFRIAARLARIWRRNAPTIDATRVSTEGYIQKVHSSLVEAGNTLYFKTGGRALAQETFESAEANRAASLRALLAEPRDWRRNVPPEYWETLRKLESAEVDSLRSRDAGLDRIRQLQGELIQLESRAGSNTGGEMPGLLEHTQQTLRPDSAFFAFHLASQNSYLWAVSRERFALYRLPPGPDIAAQVSRFSQSLHRGNTGDLDAGSRLFRTLFSQLDPVFRNKSRWLLALDAQLFELPFAALVVETGPQGPVFLAERHSLQIISGAGLLSPSNSQGALSGPFLGIADPIYNMADPRWTGSRPHSFFGSFTALAGDSAAADLQLARLAGSARETAACAAAWSGTREPVLLEGAAASRQRLQAALSGRPAVLHFATHVIGSGGSARSGLIVLSLTANGQPQVLSPTEIATWNLDGALVSLSGCSSGSADVLPGTGLMGLTRACQAAGARAVVASRWPTADDSGAFFSSFYRHLHASPGAGPALALQRAQIDMLRSHTWRAHPDYWGAYFVTGNQQ